jgi:hypothetical protein
MIFLTKPTQIITISLLSYTPFIRIHYLEKKASLSLHTHKASIIILCIDYPPSLMP